MGLAVPNFLLALVLLYIPSVTLAKALEDFLPEYINAPWSFDKFLVYYHLWIPTIVLGTAGTAEVIRKIRANLLDELHRPYVLTARAKGLTELNLVIKYP